MSGVVTRTQGQMYIPSESSLECPICTNQFTADGPLQPKILKCGHTFCTNCIRAVSETDSNLIRCSFCYAVTPTGALGIYALPINRTLVDILGNMRLQDNSMEDGAPPVDLCCYCSKNPAEKICFGCDPIGCKLCEQCCSLEHSRPFAPVKSHKPLNINEVTNLPRNVCIRHINQSLTHYSEKAAAFACKMCLAEQADDVEVEFLPIDVAIQKLRQGLPQVTESLECYLRRLQDAQRSMELTQTNLGASKSRAMQDIQQRFSKYHLIFQDRLRVLLENLETEVSDRRQGLEAQIKELHNIIAQVIGHKEQLQSLMQKDRHDFLLKYWDTSRDIDKLLVDEDFSLQRPIASPDISVYISEKFENSLRNLGSVGGGPVVVDLEAAMNESKGLLQLTWNLPEEGETVKKYEIQYDTVSPLFVKQSLTIDDKKTVECDGTTLNHMVNAICPGYEYRFRIRSLSVSGWGMWSKPGVGRFDDFPCTIGYTAKIVSIQIPSTGQYRITAKGAKAADGERFKGGRGAVISATFLLRQGDILEMLVGGMSERRGCHSGGAGGTFVTVNTRQPEGLLLVAGGGGGTRGYDEQDCDGCDASLEIHGTSAGVIHCADGGLNGAPGKDANFMGPSWGCGGAGYLQNSATAKSFIEGGAAGECGGFGGGGGVGLYGGGGGGGYSGGGGGRGGGGGGSYVREDGENVSKEVGNLGAGEVEIAKISSSPPSVAHSKSNNSNNNSREHVTKPGASPSNSSGSVSQRSSADQVSDAIPAGLKQQYSSNVSSLGSNSEENQQMLSDASVTLEPLQ